MHSDARFVNGAHRMNVGCSICNIQNNDKKLENQLLLLSNAIVIAIINVVVVFLSLNCCPLRFSSDKIQIHNYLKLHIMIIFLSHIYSIL